MTEMQGAIGRCQLQKVEGWLEERRTNAEVLTKALGDLQGVRIPSVGEHATNAFYRLTVLLEKEQDRDALVEILRESDIPAAVGPCPEIYRELAFVDAGYTPKASLPNAVKLGKRSMVLPVHPGIQPSLTLIIDQITSFCD
jgi:dTDP-4-amino-4,6-dideoxygalactose transaminase